MSQNGNGTGTAVVGVKEDVSHLTIELSQESYDLLMEVVDRATARGLESSFDHWLADAIKTGAKARIRTWDDRDGVSLLKQASRGNLKAINQLQQMLDKANATK